MKNQYFGDRRDFFKYDLLLDLVESQGSRRLTFVPMLTPNDGTPEGELTRYDCAGRRNLLYELLRTAVASNKRDIKLLREIMPRFGVEFTPYCDDSYFERHSRSQYFDSVPSDWLANSVIFFDPDIGFQTGRHSYMRRKGLEKYLMYSELAGICARVSDDSVVVVYQHLQRNAARHAGDIERRLVDLKEHLAPHQGAWAVRRGDLAFLIVVRNPSLAGRMRSTIRDHALRHGMILQMRHEQVPLPVSPT
jgi:hypothetical protein